MEWLNDNSGALTVISTFVLVIITGWYAYLTRKLVNTTSKPEVIVYLLREKVISGLVSEKELDQSLFETTVATLCIENVGTGVARKIKFGGNLAFAPYGGVPLEQIGFLKKGIALLAPGQKIERNQVSRLTESVDLSQTPIDIDIVYEDLQGKEYSRTFTLDFSESDLPPLQSDSS